MGFAAKSSESISPNDPGFHQLTWIWDFFWKALFFCFRSDGWNTSHPLYKTIFKITFTETSVHKSFANLKGKPKLGGGFQVHCTCYSHSYLGLSGEMIQFDSYLFNWGWNHQLESLSIHMGRFRLHPKSYHLMVGEFTSQWLEDLNRDVYPAPASCQCGDVSFWGSVCPNNLLIFNWLSLC